MANPVDLESYPQVFPQAVEKVIHMWKSCGKVVENLWISYAHVDKLSTGYQQVMHRLSPELSTNSQAVD